MLSACNGRISLAAHALLFVHYNTCRPILKLMSESRWNDRKCSLCGALAHYRTEMYRSYRPVPELEFLCRSCRESTELPDETIVMTTNCAEPDCTRTAQGRIELLGETGEISEIHYLCAEHAWRWRQSMGAEREMTALPLGLRGRQHGRPRSYLRDEGAPWGDESDKVN